MTPAKPATVRCAAEIVREAVNKAISALEIREAVTWRELATLAATYAIAEQQKDFNAQLAALRAECESKREWRDRKEGT